MQQYLTIFKEVRGILEQQGLKDEAISDNYQSIFTKLNPNPFTFQQVMVDYLSEFGVKSLDFVDQTFWSNGIRVRRSEKGLIVTAVTGDNRFVVGDKITHLSGDSVQQLSDRYQKLLFNELVDRQDWLPILKKQHSAALLRGDQTYTFDLKAFDENGETEVYKRNGFTEVIVHHVRDFYHYLMSASGPQLIDIRNAYGVMTETRIDEMTEKLPVHSIVLIDALTKGSAERFASKLDKKQLVGQETYGQAGILNKKRLDDQFFIYPESKDSTVEPGTMVKLSSDIDTIRNKGIEQLNR
ncbi:hypothetical protein ERX37_03905 [Macrococcus hajekii]|uniref:Tail specific protease domain-containing protein n=1 Tax=Macrococcus hajekii TaxID=198482 RepID=A0A4R6BNA2_9STAP|nr:hypothetical protein [Macrococcus hajekii]TDM03238.1 hypothetical protein ERX37_03905 [Macrococcus hajekii]GGA97213.1 hypothetical protein GCM10007190_01480 [Macrococcus hajekii]